MQLYIIVLGGGWGAIAEVVSSIAQPDYPIAQPDNPIAQPDHHIAQPDNPVAQPDYPIAQPVFKMSHCYSDANNIRHLTLLTIRLLALLLGSFMCMDNRHRSLHLVIHVQTISQLQTPDWARASRSGSDIGWKHSAKCS